MLSQLRRSYNWSIVGLYFCFDLSVQYFVCVSVYMSVCLYIMPLQIVINLESKNLIQIRSHVYVRIVFIILPFLNAGRFVDLCRSYGQTHWPIVRKFVWNVLEITVEFRIIVYILLRPLFGSISQYGQIPWPVLMKYGFIRYIYKALLF